MTEYLLFLRRTIVKMVRKEGHTSKSLRIFVVKIQASESVEKDEKQKNPFEDSKIHFFLP